MQLKSVMEMSCTGVYCLINDTSSFVQVYGAINMFDHLNRILKRINSGEFGSMRDDLDLIEIMILETCSEDTVRICTSKWIQHYENKGFKFYKNTNLVRYKVRSEYQYYKKKLYYMVFLENTRRDRILLALFRKHKECQAFIKEHYANGVGKVVYANNEETDLLLEVFSKRLK